VPNTTACYACARPDRQAETLFSNCPLVRLFVLLLISCEHEILTTNEPTLMPVGTTGSRG